MKALEIVDVRLISSVWGDDHRYPFSEAMNEVGYGLFEPLPGHADLPPLWPLATSEEAASRARFLRVLQLFEGRDPLNPTVLDIALAILGGTMRPDVQLVDLGLKDGERQFAIASGERHAIAVVFLWGMGFRKEPCLQAEIVGRT